MVVANLSTDETRLPYPGAFVISTSPASTIDDEHLVLAPHSAAIIDCSNVQLRSLIGAQAGPRPVVASRSATPLQ